jgi:hypothetical protein
VTVKRARPRTQSVTGEVGAGAGWGLGAPVGDAQRFIAACLELVNWQPGEDPRIAGAALNAIRPWNLADHYQAWAGKTYGLPETWRRPPPLRDELRKALTVIRKPRAVAALREEANAVLRDRESFEVRTTLVIAPDGKLEHTHHYAPANDRGAWGLFVALMLEHGSRLRRCSLAGCERYFLRGSRARMYCSDEHATKAENMYAACRMARMRERNARRHK